MSFGGARPSRPPWPGAWRWCCPASGCAPTPSGYVKKNRELTVTGPYAHTRNPLYLGSMLIAAGFALALLSWPVALVLAVGFCCHLHSGHRLGRALSARHISRLRRLLPPRAPADSAPDSRETTVTGGPCRPVREELTGDEPGGFSFDALPQAPRVQCCYRGRTALPQPALPAAGAGSDRAWAAVSVFRINVSQILKEPRPTVKTRTYRINPFLRLCPGRSGSRPAGAARGAGFSFPAEADPHLLRGLARLSRRHGRAAL